VGDAHLNIDIVVTLQNNPVYKLGNVGQNRGILRSSTVPYPIFHQLTAHDPLGMSSSFRITHLPLGKAVDPLRKMWSLGSTVYLKQQHLCYSRTPLQLITTV